MPLINFEIDEVFSEDNLRMIEQYARDNQIPKDYAIYSIVLRLTRIVGNKSISDFFQEALGEAKGKVEAKEVVKAKESVETKEVVKATESAVKRVKPASIIPDEKAKETSLELNISRDTEIDKLPIGNRSINALRKFHGVETAADLVNLTDDQIYNTKGLGKKSFAEIFSVRASLVSRDDEGDVKEDFSEQKDSAKRTFGVLERINELEGSREDLKEIVRIYRDITGSPESEVRAIFEAEGFDYKTASSYEDGVRAIKNYIPAQGEQIREIYDLTERLGESKYIAEVERPSAYAGKKLFELSVVEAEGLLWELRKETKEDEDTSSGSDPFAEDQPENFF